VGGDGLGAGWRGETQPSPPSNVGGNGPSAGGEPGSVRSPGGSGMQRTLWLLEGQSQQTARAEALQVQISQLELQLRAQLHAATRAEQQRCDAVGLHAAMTHDLSETQERFPPPPRPPPAARHHLPAATSPPQREARRRSGMRWGRCSPRVTRGSRRARRA
jgi:hypothetical protein